MCQEFHCECCSDDLPLIDCICDGCFHDDDESSKASDKDPDRKMENKTKYDVTTQGDLTNNCKESTTCNEDKAKQVDGVKKVASMCCEGENGENNSCCVQDLTRDSENTKSSPCCKQTIINLEGRKSCPDSVEQKVCCQSDKKPCCSSGKQLDVSDSSCQESCSPKKICGEKANKTTSRCCQSDKEPCCSSGKQLQESERSCQESCCTNDSGEVEELAQNTPRCPSQGKSCIGTPSSSKTSPCEKGDVIKETEERSSCCSVETPDSNLPHCLKEREKTCPSKNTSCSSKESENSGKEDSEALSTCCSRDTSPKGHKNKLSNNVKEQSCCSTPPKKCCERNKEGIAKCCSSESDRKNEVPRKEEKSCCSRPSSKKCCEGKRDKEETAKCCSSEPNEMPQPSLNEKTEPTCCAIQNHKCCEKEKEHLCASQEVESSCCKENEEIVLLTGPSEEEVPLLTSVDVIKRPLMVRRNTTKLRVQNICCAMEAQLVQECLKPLEGVQSVAVNVIGRVVHVRHDPDVTSPTELVESLNRVHLGATVMEIGAHQDKENGKMPRLLKLVFVYVFVQTVLLITAVTGLFLRQSWYMWVAIAEIIFGGAPILKHALISIKNRRIDINILMLIAIIGTLAISEWVEGATVVYVFAFADALQQFCMFRVHRTISRLMLKRPEVAVLVETGLSVPIESVAVGTLIAVRPGELIPLDGVVVKGSAAVDESSITGESLPVEKSVFSKVYSGTVNQNGYIEVETTTDSSSSTVSKVAQMVQEAQSSSTKTEAIINRFAKYYTPLIVVIAVLVVVVPAILGASGVGTYLQDIREWGRRALVMLVIACPCALVMATPIAVVCSITAAARKGALVKGGEHLETLSKIKVLAFDKTGTLTEGKFQVMNMECNHGENEREVLRLAAGLESKSVHPIAAAIVNEFSGCVAEMVKNQVITLPEVTQYKMYEGQGISGVIENKLVLVGNREMLEQCGTSLNESMAEKYALWSNESKTVVFVCVDEKLALMIALADAIRPSTSISLDWLRNIGVQTSMITGDNSRTAKAVSRNLRLDECVSEMKPHEKLEWIKQKQESKTISGASPDNSSQSWKCCRKSRDQHLMVGMVGDGVNDGPALASANVGIAMGAGGTALAVEAADVALMSNNLAKIPELITLAKFCNLVVKQNIVLSVLLKVCIVIIALSGYVALWMAVVADVAGLLFVIINGLRPLAWKASKSHTKGKMDAELSIKKKAKTFSTYETIV